MGRTRITVLLVVLAVIVCGVILLKAPARPYAPVQPIAYDHWQHVTKEEGPGLECTFCHENADKSSHATIPNINTCMACHETTRTDSPEVQKLASYAGRGEQPPWVRVYWLPPSANAYFTHKPHVKAGLQCTECHGQVPQMHRMRREVNQSMGWCIDCHRQRRVSNDCYVCHR